MLNRLIRKLLNPNPVKLGTWEESQAFSRLNKASRLSYLQQLQDNPAFRNLLYKASQSTYPDTDKTGDDLRLEYERSAYASRFVREWFMDTMIPLEVESYGVSPE